MPIPQYQIEHTLVDAAGNVAWLGHITFDPKGKKLLTKTLHQDEGAAHTERSTIVLRSFNSGDAVFRVFRVEMTGEEHRDVESSGNLENLYRALLAPSLPATYRRQAWVNDHAVVAGDPVGFDALHALFKGTEHDLGDLHVHADFLAQDLPEHKDHGGPFEVDVDFEECVMVAAAWSGDFYVHWQANSFDVDVLSDAQRNLAGAHPHLLTLIDKPPIEADDVRPGYAKVRLVLDVEYQLSPGITAQDMVSTLQSNIGHSIGDGLLTGPYHEVEVESHSVCAEVKAEGPEILPHPSPSAGA